MALMKKEFRDQLAEQFAAKITWADSCDVRNAFGTEEDKGFRVRLVVTVDLPDSSFAWSWFFTSKKKPKLLHGDVLSLPSGYAQKISQKAEDAFDKWLWSEERARNRQCS